MRVRRGWGRMAGLAVAGLVLVSACAADRRHVPLPDDPDANLASAEPWGDLDDEGAVNDLLDPEQRDAVARAGFPGAERPAAEQENAGDTAGKVGLSVLSVALSVGAAVAPFLLF